jgi:GH25 family lysozyme M1 (1,4-beta-N-acetylmuramidase)
MTAPICIDLSHWNPTPNWSQLKSAGCEGVVHKATEGTSYVDDQLFSRARPAMDAGLLWSTYHFMKPGSIFAQMDHYLSTINPKQGERIVLDHEDPGVYLDQLEAAVVDIMEMRPDLQITIYSGHLIKEQLSGTRSDILAQNTSLWVAQYTTAPAPSWPTSTWPQWSLWQYTDHAMVTGCSKPVDANRFNGTADAFKTWMGPPSTALIPPVESGAPIEPVVRIETQGGVKVWLNGVLIG